MTTELIIEVIQKRNLGSRNMMHIIYPGDVKEIATEIHAKQEELLKRCWQAGVEYGSNRTDENFNDFKQQEGI
jgi:hypothetical protein